MGSIQKKGKIWYAVFPEKDREKRYRYKWVRLGEMKKYDAQVALAAEQTRRKRSIYKDIRKISFRELARIWLESQKLDKKPRTTASYAYQISHLLPFVGDSIVSEIFPEDIETFKREMLKKVSATTVNYDLRILRSILDTAISWGYSYENPAKLVKKLKQEKKQFHSLTKEEVNILIESAEGQDKCLLMAAIMTGMRLGEILAMKWENLDWENKIYTVKESYSAFGFNSPKTENSFRRVNLTEKLIQALREQQAEQNQQRSKKREEYKSQGLIFSSEIGTPINPSNLRSRIFQPILKEAGLPKSIRFHDLRGAYATLALESGANLKYVQNQLGHKTAEITLDIYAKLNEAARKESSDKLEAYLQA